MQRSPSRRNIPPQISTLVGVELRVAPQSSLTEVCSEDFRPHYKPQKNRNRTCDFHRIVSRDAHP
ncbi:MAG: hypothetical protein GDA48_06925 [Hormoscilla sp. GM102CHS1]|nr:hypothetical protein [Hormoscilla sp. GM102CHS1]